MIYLVLDATQYPVAAFATKAEAYAYISRRAVGVGVLRALASLRVLAMNVGS